MIFVEGAGRKTSLLRFVEYCVTRNADRECGNDTPTDDVALEGFRRIVPALQAAGGARDRTMFGCGAVHRAGRRIELHCRDCEAYGGEHAFAVGEFSHE